MTPPTYPSPFQLQDDIIDEVDHLIAAAKCLKERGTYKSYAVATHGLFSPEDAPQKLQASPIDEVPQLHAVGSH